jgi:hypothetical protein
VFEVDQSRQREVTACGGELLVAYKAFHHNQDVASTSGSVFHRLSRPLMRRQRRGCVNGLRIACGAGHLGGRRHHSLVTPIDRIQIDAVAGGGATATPAAPPGDGAEVHRRCAVAQMVQDRTADVGPGKGLESSY